MTAFNNKPAYLKTAIPLAVFILAYIYTPSAMADFQAACTNVGTFFGRVISILKYISAAIVTIAIVFAGYQIAFAHKRISDVAPIVIGGLLIGGAITIAGWFVSSWDDTSSLGVAIEDCSGASSS